MKPLLLLLASVSLAAAAPTSIATGGKSLVPVIHAENASESVVQATSDLSSVLHRMIGADFALESGGEPRGIVVGTVAEFPSVPGADKLNSVEPLRREEYLIHSDGQRLWLIGATDAGASHAVWDFLHRLGYRQYFPGENWEIVPPRKEVTADFDLFESPAYKFRSFAWHLGGSWRDVPGLDSWLTRNRIASPKLFPDVFVLQTLHIYGAIFKRFRDEFDANPDMRSIINGKPTSKLNPANEKTRAVVKQFAAEYFEEKPQATSISMDPSDGGGWGTSPEELAIGTPSDRAVFLANLVAKSINQSSDTPRYVGLYAYNEHSPAPSEVRVDPRVIVSFATAFVKGGFTVPELMAGWQKTGTELMGMREYHSVVAWDLSRPTGGRAANLDYLAQTIPEYHGLGARFYITEAGQNWGPQGLGNYFTTRLLWNPKEADQKDTLLEEFMANCFPEAQEPMLRFYRECIHPPKAKLFTRDLLGTMYRALDEAKKQTHDPASLRRIDDLLVYTRFSELLFAHATRGDKSIEARVAAMAEVIKFSYRTRMSDMVSSVAFFRDVPNRNKDLPLPENTDWKIPEGENPWKSSKPFTREERDGWLAAGIKNNPLLDFESVEFSKNLVPASRLSAAASYDAQRTARKSGYFRRTNRIYTWCDSVDLPIKFTGKAGLVYTNLGDATVSLYPAGQDETATLGEETKEEEENTPVFLQASASVTIPPDKEEHDISLQPKRPGGWIVETKDQAGGIVLSEWPETLPYTLEFSLENSPVIVGRTHFVFYVPKGTRTLGFYARGGGTILNPDQVAVYELPNEAGFHSIPVSEGADGAFWSFQGLTGGQLMLMTVPPYMAPSASQLMLPKEVVEADSQNP